MFPFDDVIIRYITLSVTNALGAGAVKYTMDSRVKLANNKL